MKDQPEIVVYATKTCPYCIKTKSFFEEKGYNPVFVYIDGNQDLIQKLKEVTQRRTVPQIFIQGHHMGGYTDVKASWDNGELQGAFQKAPIKLVLPYKI